MVSAMSAEQGSVSNSIVVYDAFQGRVYANYIWINAKGKKYWEVAPTECDVCTALRMPHREPIRTEGKSGKLRKGILVLLKINNWSEFQHYKHRCPPWIKLQQKVPSS